MLATVLVVERGAVDRCGLTAPFVDCASEKLFDAGRTTNSLFVHTPYYYTVCELGSYLTCTCQRESEAFALWRLRTLPAAAGALLAMTGAAAAAPASALATGIVVPE